MKKSVTKKAIATVTIEVTPFVCLDCGQLQLMEDKISRGKAGNCNACCEDNIVKAGVEQKVRIAIQRRWKPAFDKGEN